MTEFRGTDQRGPVRALCEIGLFAAIGELVLAVSITAAYVALIRLVPGISLRGIPHAASIYWGPFLKWSYLATALGVIFTDHKFVTRATHDLRRNLRLLPKPQSTADAAFLRFFIVALGSAYVVTRGPPTALLSMAQHIGLPWLAYGWPILWTTHMAAFGALTRAAHRAIR